MKKVPGKCIHSAWVTEAYYGPCKWLWVMTKLQGRFGIRNRQYFENFTGFKVPETRGDKNFYFFQNSLRRSLNFDWRKMLRYWKINWTYKLTQHYCAKLAKILSFFMKNQEKNLYWFSMRWSLYCLQQRFGWEILFTKMCRHSDDKHLSRFQWKNQNM